MKGLMMDFQLTLPTILKRAETYFPHQEIVTRMPDRSFHRYSFADFGKRARQLAVALKGLGLEPGDRVATLCWNHYQHLEAYLGIPSGGYVLHTLNLRLHPNDLGYIATHAGDKAVIVDKSLLPLWELFKDKTPIEHVLVVEDSYEELLAGADPGRLRGSEARRGHGRGDVLHERHDRDAEGRPLLAPLDRPAHARPGARGAARPARDRDGDVPAGRADVPRERVGLSVHVPDGRREARLPRPVPRPGDAARRLRAGGRHDHRRACRRSGWASSACSTRSPTAGTWRSCTRCSSAARPRRGR